MIEDSVLRVNYPPVDKVKSALKKCAKIGGCDGCPYMDDDKCQTTLRSDMLKIIEWLQKNESTTIVCSLGGRS